MQDNVNHPSHYNTGKIEVIDFIEDQLTSEEFKGFCKGNILKYLCRAENKGTPPQDYKKANWYLTKLIIKSEE